ncbi:MAG: MlaD family protein [Betaproteobacteria bacterium]
MTAEELPQARVRHRRIFQLVWVVPLVAIAIAAWLTWQHFERLGPEIGIQFTDASGVRPGQTPLLYRGVPVGEVTRLGLAEDHRHVVVRVRVQKEAQSLATEGAQFWIVRPQLGWGNVTGLNTVLTGPEIHMVPGKGETAKAEFVGRETAPVDLQIEGLRIVLRAVRPKSVRVNTPVYYRGVEVGAVQKVDLAPNSASADVHVLIFRRYTGLVRDGTAFWYSGGASFIANLREGVRFEMDSFRSVVTGGIEFATPSEKMPRAKQGQVFFLYDEPRKEWLAWTPRIAIPPER